MEHNPMRSLLFSAVLIAFIISSASFCQGADLKLIDAAQLRGSLSKWVVLDARPVKEWEKAHIPGALSLSWESYTRTDEEQIPYRILPPEEMAEALGKLGISSESAVVIYGDADESWGGEGWGCWMFAWMGHQGDVRVLSGGVQAWESNRYSLTSDDNRSIKPVEYRAAPLSSMNISAREIHDNPAKYQLVDTRSTLEWFKGHLPDAIHIPWEKFFKGKQRTPLDSSELKALLSKSGVNIENHKNLMTIEADKDIGKNGKDIGRNSVSVGKKVVYYCTGGIRSGYAWMVHSLAALPEAMNFEGGTAEWDRVIKR